MSKPPKKPVKRSLFLQAVNIGGVSFLQIVYLSVLARFLSPSDFGAAAVAYSITLSFTLFAQAGMGPAIIQYNNPNFKHHSTAFITNLVIGLLGALILFFSSPFLSGFFEAPELEDILPVIGITIPIAAVASTCISIAQRRMDFKYLLVCETAAAISGMTAGILLARSGFNVWALIYGAVVQNSTLLLLLALKVKIPLTKGWRMKNFRDLRSFAAGVTSVRFVDSLHSNGLNILLGALMPMRSLGIFERSLKFSVIPGKLVGDVLHKVFFPVLSRLKGDASLMRIQFLRVLSIVFILSIPLVVLLSWKSEFMVLLLLGNNWLMAIEPMSILFICIPFRIVYRFSDALLQSLGAPFAIAMANLVSFIFLLLAIYFSIDAGVIGVSWAFLYCAFVQFCLILFLALRKLSIGFKQLLPSFSSAILPSLLMLIPCLLSEQLPQTDALFPSAVQFALIPVFWLLLLIGMFRVFPKAMSPVLFDLMTQAALQIRRFLPAK